MADAAVEFLLSNLKNLVLHHSNLITNAKSQIQRLEDDLRIFDGFLKDSVKKRRKDSTTQALIQNIREVVYELEDIIDTFVTQATDSKTRNCFIRSVKIPLNLHEIGTKVQAITEKVEQNRIDLVSLTSSAYDDKSEKSEAWPQYKKDMVGFIDVRNELIGRLTEEINCLDVIALTGMFGLGKTTVAWNVFNDDTIFHKFPKRIWLTISQEFSNKNIFLNILKEFTDIRSLHEEDDQNLAQMASQYLEHTKFLIVMDDVWSHTDWDRLKDALHLQNKMCKVLITTRNEEVGKYASRQRDIHPLRIFKQDESWELLRMEALEKLNCPKDLEVMGQIIANDCKGLPLAIVIIGGILATKVSSNINVTRRAWEKVSAGVIEHLNKAPGERMKKLISLSYDNLPYHLRACFLYLGIFPKDYEIPVSKLICMWIGEGFVQQNSTYSLEETAEKHLEELINRNLVRIEKVKPNGKVKSCKIHDTLREFARSEAESNVEKFLQEIKPIDGGFIPAISEIHNYRRLSIHSNCSKFITSTPLGPHVRSFVCLSDEKFPPSRVYSNKAIPAAFKLLRVLEVKPMRFSEIPNHMYQLIHMRYMAFSSFKLSILPSDFVKLWNIQTLIIETTNPTLDVKADIWKMSHLRHFKTNASATLPTPSKKNEHGAELQALGTISAESCTTELFARACNLKKLGIRGKLALLFEGNSRLFESLGKLTKLEKLKLINDVCQSSSFDGQLSCLPQPCQFPPNRSSFDGQLSYLPQPCQFPPNLKILTLSATSLDWSCMSNIALLGNLEVLKLKDNAFVGKTWEPVNNGFRLLEFLHIEQTELYFWAASSHHFPKLRGLVLKNCHKLINIPSDMVDIPTFQMLELYNCTSGAAVSARAIHDKKISKQVEGEGSTKFNLSIYPPTE